MLGHCTAVLSGFWGAKASQILPGTGVPLGSFQAVEAEKYFKGDRSFDGKDP